MHKNLPIIPFVPFNAFSESDKSFAFASENAELTSFIHYFKQVNCFIGANNSGKSRTLRAILKSKNNKPAFKVDIKQNIYTEIIPAIKMEAEYLTAEDKEYIQAIQYFLDNHKAPLKDINTAYRHFLILTENALDFEEKINKKSVIFNFFNDFCYENRIIAKNLHEANDNNRQKLIDEQKEFLQNGEQLTQHQKEQKDIEKIISLTKDSSELNSKINQLERQISDEGSGKYNLERNLREIISQKKDAISLIESWTAQLRNSSTNTNVLQREENIKVLSTNIADYEERLKGYEEKLLPLNMITKNIDDLKKEIVNMKDKQKAMNNEIETLKWCNGQYYNYNYYKNDEQRLQSVNDLIQSFEEKIKENEISIANLKNEIPRIEKEIIVKTQNELIKHCSLLRNEFQKWLASFNHTQEHVYIPILRGTRPLNDNKEDFYASRTQKDYKINDSFTGLSLYEDLKSHLLGSHKERVLMKEFEEFLSKHFFDKQAVTLIPNIKSDVLFMKIGENEERAIYEFGDGIQALIILIFPLFMYKEHGALIFIEEPELHLHPKWQRFFLNIIKTDFPQHQFFFTTHSNIFLSDNDVALYKVSQDGATDKDNAKTAIQHIKTEHQEILSELGYKTSDLLHANYIIWIEGISDRIYLKKMIAILEPDLIEGIDYTFMFFGGCSNFLHHINYNEKIDTNKINILSINVNCGFILDSDFKQPKQNLEKIDKKRYALQEYCKKQQKFCWISEFREIENHIPIEIWKEAAENYAKSVNNNQNKTVENVEFDANTLLKDTKHHFSDRFKTKVFFESPTSTSICINDKIKAAKEVVKIFPKNTAALKHEKELYNAIEKLIKDIEKAKFGEKR